MAYTINLQLIQKKRKEQGYSLQEMADLLGLKTRSEYFKRENGDYRFKSVELPVLAKALKVPMSYFFTQKVDKIET